MIYSAPNYSMGATTAPPQITTTEKTQAEAALRKMKRSLSSWLKYRKTLQDVATGLRPPRKLPARTVALMLANRNVGLEQRLASELHVLLSEMFDAASLPEPDLTKNPTGAVALAQIAIAGKLPGDAIGPGQGALGFVWLWPAVVVIGMVLLTMIFKINSDAALAAEEMRTKCIESGLCTDYGFWLKVGGIALVAWLAWEKFGGKEAARRLQT